MTSNDGNMQRRLMNPSMGVMTASGHAQAALAAMPPLHRSNTDGPRRHVLPKKASFKSKGSILSHVTSGTWEEDADIENPHDAEEARKSPRVGSTAKSTHLLLMLCHLFSRPSDDGMGEASKTWPRPGTRAACNISTSACQALTAVPHATRQSSRQSKQPPERDL